MCLVKIEDFANVVKGLVDCFVLGGGLTLRSDDVSREAALVLTVIHSIHSTVRTLLWAVFLGLVVNEEGLLARLLTTLLGGSDALDDLLEVIEISLRPSPRFLVYLLRLGHMTEQCVGNNLMAWGRQGAGSISTVASGASQSSKTLLSIALKLLAGSESGSSFLANRFGIMSGLRDPSKEVRRDQVVTA